MNYIFRFIVITSFCWFVSLSHAHESWIEPENYRINSGDQIRAHIRVGQNFLGNSHSYNKQEYKTLTVTNGSETKNVKGRLGDVPAMQIRDTRDGLYILRHQSLGSILEYDDFEKFEIFATNNGLEDYLSEHKQRKKPTDFFKERFIRYSKSLIAVGHGKGNDAIGSFPLEMIALKNPYELAENEVLPVKLVWQNQPLANWQITIFEKFSDETTAKSKVLTNAEGIAEISVQSHSIMLNAVQLYDPESTGYDRKTVWESAWASLTFSK